MRTLILCALIVGLSLLFRCGSDDGGKTDPDRLKFLGESSWCSLQRVAKSAQNCNVAPSRLLGDVVRS